MSLFIIVSLFLALLSSGCGMRMRSAFELQYKGLDAPVSSFDDAPDDYQIRFIASLIDGANSNGLRCPRPGVSVGAIRYELLTRLNQGRIPPTAPVYYQINQILSDAGCGIDNGRGLVPLVTAPQQKAQPQLPAASVKLRSTSPCDNLVPGQPVRPEYGCDLPVQAIPQPVQLQPVATGVRAGIIFYRLLDAVSRWN